MKKIIFLFPFRYIPPLIWGKSGHIQTALYGKMGRVRSPHPYGHRKFITMSDGATSTFDLFEPLAEHCIGGESRSYDWAITWRRSSSQWGSTEFMLVPPTLPSIVSGLVGTLPRPITYEHLARISSSMCLPVASWKAEAGCKGLRENSEPWPARTRPQVWWQWQKPDCPPCFIFTIFSCSPHKSNALLSLCYWWGNQSPRLCMLVWFVA